MQTLNNDQNCSVVLHTTVSREIAQVTLYPAQMLSVLLGMELKQKITFLPKIS